MHDLTGTVDISMFLVVTDLGFICTENCREGEPREGRGGHSGPSRHLKQIFVLVRGSARNLDMSWGVCGS